ncbi:MAG: DNA cytosine methyltransferase, partial [Oscillospiraceae bacterium]|nr:DNA cytosine methyltransferase [Oscillospiraceae bacterium]
QFQKVAETGMSDAQLYKQAGNAVTVNVVEALAKNLLRFDEQLRKK